MLPLLTILVVIATQLSTSQGDSCGRVVCYHTNWSQYRPGSGKFFPDNIDPSLCTHIIYAFAKLSGDHLAAFEWNDDSTDWSVGLYEKFMNLKQKNPALKTLLAVGGWNLGSQPFHQMVQTDSHRREFVTQSIKFLRDRGFDGLDFDWEYPANRGSPPEDKKHFIEILTAMKKGFEEEAQRTGKPRLLLSAAVAAGKTNIDTAYDIPAMANLLDLVNLMSYDLHGSWEQTTGHNSPLYATGSETGDNRYLNIDWAAQYWVQNGMPASMMNIGMGLYGRSFTLDSASNSDVGAPASRPGQAGKYTREAGFIAYYEVCDMLKAGGQEEWINEAFVPYVHQGAQWVGYDNPKSLKEKVRYVKSNNFGGVMVWSLPLDDFSGTHCGQGPFPLMHAIADECQHSSGSLVTPAPHKTTARPTNAPGHTSGPVTTHQSHTMRPSGDFTCPNNDGFYASPSSCGEYYVCASHIAYLVRCAEGLVFNPSTGFCDWPRNYHCTLGDAPTATPHQPVHTTPQQVVMTSQAPTNTPHHTHTHRPHTPRPHTDHPHHGHTTTGPTDLTNFCKSHADGPHADPTDCTYFIECSNGRMYKEKCAPGTAWSNDIETCDRIENVAACNKN